MNRQQLLDKAIYIQFPINQYEKYKIYEGVKNINYLPIHDSMLYKGVPANEHHYVFDYSYKFVLPLLGQLCNFKFNKNDFILKVNRKTFNEKTYSFSYLIPKQKYKYKVTSFEYGTSFIGEADKLMFNPDIAKTWATEYHKIVPFPHSCFKIINLSLKSNKKILISGDSQMLPSIVPLTSYFKEVWYYDNRTDPHISHESTYKNVNFDYVIIALYRQPIEKYTTINLS